MDKCVDSLTTQWYCQFIQVIYTSNVNNMDHDEDIEREREDEAAEREELYAEQYTYRGTDFKPAAGWY